MDKERETSNPKVILSGLCPARKSDEIPVVPFVIKTEPDPLFTLTQNSAQGNDKDAFLRTASQETEISTGSMVEAEGTDNSNCSATSTATELADVSSNQIVPTSFEHVSFKQEPIESTVTDTEGGVKNNHAEKSVTNAASTSFINEQGNTTSEENNETFHAVNAQEINNTTVNIKTESINNNSSSESQNYRDENSTSFINEPQKKSDTDDNETSVSQNGRNVNMAAKKKLGEKEAEKGYLKAVSEKYNENFQAVNEQGINNTTVNIKTEPINNNGSLQPENYRNENSTSSINEQKKTAPEKDNGTFQADSDQQLNNAVVNIKTKPINNNDSLESENFRNKNSTPSISEKKKRAPERNETPQAVNDQKINNTAIKTEPIINNALSESQNCSDENVTINQKLDIDSNDSSESQNCRNGNAVAQKKSAIDDNNDPSESQNNRNVNMAAKRKLGEKEAEKEFEDKLEILRKRLKSEPLEDDQEISIPMNEDDQDTPIPAIEDNQDALVPMNEGDQDTLIPAIEDKDASVPTNDSLQTEMCHDDMEIDEITFLPVAKKPISVLTLLDDDNDDDDHHHRHQQITPTPTSTVSIPENTAINKKFSIDTLKYFNVVSELDRLDCQKCLDFLSNYETKNATQKLFPVIKKERKMKSKIQKDDILFKRITTDITDTENESISPFQPHLSESTSSCVNLSNQNADLSQPVTGCDSYSAPLFPPAPQFESFSSSRSLPFDGVLEPEIASRNIQPASQFNFNPSVPSTSQAAMAFPNTPTADRESFEINVPQNAQVEVFPSASNLSAGTGNYNFAHPSTSQSAMILPNIPVTDRRRFEVNVPQNSQIEAFPSASNLSAGAGSYNFSHPLTSQSAMILPNTSMAGEGHFEVNVPQNSQVEAFPSTSNLIARIGNNLNFPSLSTSPSAMVFPNTSIAERAHFEVNMSQNFQIQAPPSSVNLSTAISLDPSLMQTVSEILSNMPLVAPQQDPCDQNQTLPVGNLLESLQDPRLRKKPRLENNGVNAPVLSHSHKILENISYTSLAAPLQDPHDQNRTLPVGNSSELLQDPRLRKRYRLENSNADASVSSHSHITGTAEFPNRKGKRDLLLFQNVGRDDVTQHFIVLILQWNPEWLEIQRTSGCFPPICTKYPKVSFSFRNDMDYYNTYVPLLMLHIWCNIYKCWENKTYPTVERCKVLSMQKSDNDIKITCSVQLNETQVWPKRDDIIWCKNQKEEAFLCVSSVSQKKLNSGIFKLRIELLSIHDFQFNDGDLINFCILYNVSAACLQTEALNSVDSAMKEVVLRPEAYTNSIKFIELDIHKSAKDQRDSVLKAPGFNETPIIVIKTYPAFDKITLLSYLTYNITRTPSKKQVKVVIFVKSDELLAALYNRLRPYDPVLAVRTKQVKLESEFLNQTIEYRLERKESLNDILNNNHMFLSTFSAFGKSEKVQLAKLKNLYCILDDAHLCTEVETALPLTLKIKKLLLLGNESQLLQLPKILEEHYYNVTFFTRLLKVKPCR